MDFFLERDTNRLLINEINTCQFYADQHFSPKPLQLRVYHWKFWSKNCASTPSQEKDTHEAGADMNPAHLPIGVFDSGLGGLTVLRAIHERLPWESTIYFGDSGRTPYGTKSKDTIIKYSLQIARFLLEKKVKMIVIACNTASSHAFEAVRNFAPVPVIEVITPGANAGAAATTNQKIGIIGTKGTVNSGVYVEAVRAASTDTLRSSSRRAPCLSDSQKKAGGTIRSARQLQMNTSSR